MAVEPAIKPSNGPGGPVEILDVYLPEKSLAEWAIAGTLFFFSVLYLWPFCKVSTLNPDEGIALQGAQRILSGQVLYRDFFSFLTPGSYYWLALRFKIFGSTFAVARTALAVYGGIFSVLTYLLARRVCPRWAAVFTAYLLLIVGLPFRFLVLHNWDSLLWAYLALYSAVRLRETTSWGWAFATGTLASLTFLFEQSKGVGLILGLALGFFLIAYRRPHPSHLRPCTFAMLAGLAWPVVLTLLYFSWHSSLGPMFNDWFWPLQHYSRANRLPYGYITLPFDAWNELYGGGWTHRLLSILLTSPLFILPLLPFVALGVGAFHTYRMRKAGRVHGVSGYYILVCATSLGLVLSTVATGRPDTTHLFYVGPPLVLMLGWIVGGRPLASQLIAKLQPLCVAGLLITFTAFGLILLIGGPLGAKTRLETRRGVLALTGSDAVIPYVEEHVPAGDEIFVYPYQPMYYFLTATFNPTRFEFLQLGMHAPEQMDEAMDELASHQAKAVLFALSFNSETVSELWPATSTEALGTDRVRDFLFAHYRPCRALESFRWGFVYMVRRDLACPDPP